MNERIASILDVTARGASWRYLAKHLMVLIVTVPNIALSGAAYAAGSGDSLRYRVGIAGDRFADTTQISASFDLDTRQRFHSDRIELSVGLLAAREDIRPFVTFGPVWRWTVGETRYFFELGISPTVLAGSTFRDESLGGNFQFTSAIVIGRRLGREGSSYVGLRLQHTSNAGLSSTNPGMDMVGVDFRVKLRAQE